MYATKHVRQFGAQELFEVAEAAVREAVDVSDELNLVLHGKLMDNATTVLCALQQTENRLDRFRSAGLPNNQLAIEQEVPCRKVRLGDPAQHQVDRHLPQLEARLSHSG